MEGNVEKWIEMLSYLSSPRRAHADFIQRTERIQQKACTETFSAPLIVCFFSVNFELDSIDSIPSQNFSTLVFTHMHILPAFLACSLNVKSSNLWCSSCKRLALLSMHAYYEQETWLREILRFVSLNFTVHTKHAMAFAASSVFFVSTLNEIKIFEFIMHRRYCWELSGRSIGQNCIALVNARIVCAVHIYTNNCSINIIFDITSH